MDLVPRPQIWRRSEPAVALSGEPVSVLVGELHHQMEVAQGHSSLQQLAYRKRGLDFLEMALLKSETWRFQDNLPIEVAAVWTLQPLLNWNFGRRIMVRGGAAADAENDRRE